MTITQHELSEWRRMALDALIKGFTSKFKKFFLLANLEEGTQMETSLFDGLQKEYRSWLVGGFEGLPEVIPPSELRSDNNFTMSQDSYWKN